MGATVDMSGYKYRMVAKGLCGINKESNNAALTVNLSPSITSQPIASTVCAGATTTFSSTAINATGYQWQVDIGSGFADVSDNSVYSGSTSSTLTITGATASMNGYLYRMVVKGLCVINDESNSAALMVNLSPSITSQPIASTVCAGATTTFSSTATNATGYQWQVDAGSGFVNIQNGINYSGVNSSILLITGVTSGMNNYQYRVVTTGSCTPIATSNSAVLTVNALTEITSQPSGSTVCAGATTTFSSTATNATGYQWQVYSGVDVKGDVYSNISDNGVYSGSTSSILTISGATSDLNGNRYRLVVYGSCGNVNSEAVVLTVNSTSAPTGASEQTLKTGDNLSQLLVVGDGIKWYATASDATNHTNSLAASTVVVDNTRYYATQTVNGCESRTYLEVLVRINDMSVEGFDKSSKIVLYPNPAKHMLTISTDARLINVGVFSLEGKQLFNKKINHNNQIDISSLPSGVYLLKIETEKGMKIEKFIKD